MATNPPVISFVTVTVDTVTVGLVPPVNILYDHMLVFVYDVLTGVLVHTSAPIAGPTYTTPALTPNRAYAVVAIAVDTGGENSLPSNEMVTAETDAHNDVIGDPKVVITAAVQESRTKVRIEYRLEDSKDQLLGELVNAEYSFNGLFTDALKMREADDVRHDGRFYLQFRTEPMIIDPQHFFIWDISEIPDNTVHEYQFRFRGKSGALYTSTVETDIDIDTTVDENVPVPVAIVGTSMLITIPVFRNQTAVTGATVTITELRDDADVDVLAPVYRGGARISIASTAPGKKVTLNGIDYVDGVDYTGAADAATLAAAIQANEPGLEVIAPTTSIVIAQAVVPDQTNAELLVAFGAATTDIAGTLWTRVDTTALSPVAQLNRLGSDLVGPVYLGGAKIDISATVPTNLVSLHGTDYEDGVDFSGPADAVVLAAAIQANEPDLVVTAPNAFTVVAQAVTPGRTDAELLVDFGAATTTIAGTLWTRVAGLPLSPAAQLNRLGSGAVVGPIVVPELIAPNLGIYQVDLPVVFYAAGRYRLVFTVTATNLALAETKIVVLVETDYDADAQLNGDETCLVYGKLVDNLNRPLEDAVVRAVYLREPSRYDRVAVRQIAVRTNQYGFFALHLLRNTEATLEIPDLQYGERIKVPDQFTAMFTSIGFNMPSTLVRGSFGHVRPPEYQ